MALRYYGDAELYRLIATASGIADPAVIDVGQRLIIPDITRYTVVAGTRCRRWRCAFMVTRN